MKRFVDFCAIGAIGMLALPTAALAQYGSPPPPPRYGGPIYGAPRGGQWWAQHPGYLHAMANLRSAYWLIQHRAPGDPVQRGEEGRAMGEIRAAYAAMTQASIRDGKDIDDQPPPNFAWGDHGGRLHRAMELLRKAHGDLSGAEDNPAARGLRNSAVSHVDAAGRWTAAAMQAWHF